QENAARPVVALREDAVIWVTDDGASLSQAIVERLHFLGFDATLADIRKHDFESMPERLDGLLIVAPEIGADDVFLTRAFERVQSAAPLLLQEGNREGAFFVTVSRLDGAFGLKERGGDMDGCSGGLAGLAKTASHEWPEVSCKAIDIDHEHTDYAEAAEHVVNEVLHAGPAEIGIDAQGLYSLELHDTPLVDTGASISIGTDDVIVITGGARGVTAEVAVAFAEAYRPTLVLLGRSAPPSPEDAGLRGAESEADIKRFLLEHADGKPSPKEVNAQCTVILANREALRTVQRIEAAGGEAIYRSVDIRDAQAVAGVLDEVRTTFGPITGVIHGAGVLADKRIEDKTLEQFRSVYDTKVGGLHALMAATHADSLKFVALFSSSTARFGRTGQVDYAIANEVLNKEAYGIAGSRPDCRVVAVNWGPWAGGMVTPALAKLFERDGIGLIDLHEGAEFLVRELHNAKGPVEIVAIAGWTAETQARPDPPENTEDDSTLSTAIELKLDCDRFPFLRSHVLDGKAVLPVSMYVEWFAHAGLHAHPGFRFHGLDQFRVFKGVVLDTGPSRPIRLLSGKAVSEDGMLRIPLELHSTDALGEDVLHARADVILTEQLPRGERTLPTIMLGGYPHPQEDLYDLEHDGVLFHGTHFQGLQHIEGCSDQGIIGLARTAPRPAEWIGDPLRKSWLADPLILDSAFQLMILWTHHKHGQVSLPVAFESYRQFTPTFPKGRIQVVAQVTEHTDHRAIATIEFVNPKNGALIARMSGYECVINESLAKAFRKNTLDTRSETASDISGSRGR
ncbi:MAG: SDR family NAD(P)-dependent oxidoreductase, partial [Candidatus Hydrogenedentes bacterium]|nr:SDR family NAD(P)-dependent oxidoreductase [Candidatus Hydrogenedentota bacterium]